MQNPQFYAFAVLFLLLLIFFNCLISRDIYNWVPSTKRQIGLLSLVWSLPIVGFFIANILGKLGWFKKKKSQGGSSAVTGGFMEMDSVLNPGVRNQIEMVEKRDSEIHQEHKVKNTQGKNTKARKTAP